MIRVKDGMILKGKIEAEVTDFSQSDNVEMGWDLIDEIHKIAGCDDFKVKIDVFTKGSYGIG